MFKTGDIQIDANERKKLAEIRNVNTFKATLKKYFLYSYTFEPDVIYYSP